jgi:hypothetical protein
LYKSAADALQGLFVTKGSPACRITRVPKPGLMANGIEYCFVEVTCAEGAQYGIEAFGGEAKDLYASAQRLQEELAIVPSARS